MSGRLLTDDPLNGTSAPHVSPISAPNSIILLPAVSAAGAVHAPVRRARLWHRPPWWGPLFFLVGAIGSRFHGIVVHTRVHDGVGWLVRAAPGGVCQ
jgi:hypothetical protein